MSKLTEPSASDDADDSLVVLLDRCAHQDIRAFDELYACVSSKLYGVALRLLREPSLAEDALQETFIKIWKKASGYDRRAGAPLAWMTSIARYQSLDMLRGKDRRQQAQSRLDDETRVMTQESSHGLEDGLADGELLQRCLGELEELQARCILLAYRDGYSHDELSERMNRPLGTVKSWIRRGLLSLRECVDALA